MENYQLMTIIGANLLVFIGFMGSVIALHIHGNNQTTQQIQSIHQEMKDFHKRLCEIEAKRKT